MTVFKKSRRGLRLFAWCALVCGTLLALKNIRPCA